jgi:hypothetical protein
MFKDVLKLFFALAGASAFLWSCDKDGGDALRKEQISVYVSKDAEEPVTQLSVPSAGGEIELYVKSNVEFTAFWQDSKTSPWLSIEEITADDEEWKTVHLKVKAISSNCYYTRRSGVLTLNVPEQYLGTFITINQGLTARLSSDFSWLKYGSANPLSTVGETHISKWSGSSLVWESTRYDESEQAACYGKYGWLYIGDVNGTKADLITPYANDIQKDSLLMVSFRAVGYTSEDGIPDAAKLRVEVIGGGVIQDYADEGRTYIDLDLENFSVENPDSVSVKMWDVKSTAYNIFVISTKDKPLSSETRIRFLTPDGNGSPNRVALDNIYIRRYAIDEDTQDEDVYAANGGSGRDRIIAPNIN